MKISELKEVLSSKTVKRVFIFLLTFIIMYSTMMTSLLTKKYNLTEGQIAKVDIKASREVVDELKTAEKIQAQIDQVDRKYSEKKEVKRDTLSELNAFFLKVIELKDSVLEEKDKIAVLSHENSVILPAEKYPILLKLSKDEILELQRVTLMTMEELFDSSIKNEPEYIRKAQENAVLKFNSYGTKLSSQGRDIGVQIASSKIKPNFFYDEKLTEEAVSEVKKKVTPEVIKKDQYIVREGEPINKYQIEILRSLGLLNNASKSQLHIYITLGVLILLVLILQTVYLKRNHQEIYEDISKLVLINILNCIALIFARSMNAVPYLIPLACSPLLLSLLINSKVALTISILNCILLSGAVGFNLQITLLALVNAVGGAVILKKMQQRNDIVYSALYISIINVMLVFSVGVLLNNNVIEVLKNVGFTLIGSCISAVLTIGFLPVFESGFDIVTSIKLLELSNPNQPLLRKLLMEAPGTYHHSILVANLSEVAAEEVGGNPLLARVSAYYHDVGKIKRPYFFKENQMGNDNPHSKITPNLSTLIITNHVKDGVELAKENRLPKVIQDVILEHHGDSLVKYFYITAKNSADHPEDIRDEDFRYPGPIPSSKESGIIMLADSVEAAVRSINEPNKEKVREMVSKLVKERLDEGQLDNCDLTLKDIDNIKKAFMKVLSGIYHERIEYPVDKWVEKK